MQRERRYISAEKELQELTYRIIKSGAQDIPGGPPSQPFFAVVCHASVTCGEKEWHRLAVFVIASSTHRKSVL